MERLTHKEENWYWKNEEFWLSAENPTLEQADNVYYKLAEFEDFIEEQGFKSLEDFKKALETQLPDDKVKQIALEAMRKEMKNHIAQILRKEVPELYKYKDNWQKLKEWVVSFENFLEQAKVEKAKRTGVYMRAKLISTESLKLKMQKLEKE